MKIYISIIFFLFLTVSIVRTQVWEPCYKGLENQTVLSLAVNGEKIFAGTDKGKLFLSSDNGETWTNIYSIGSDIRAIKFDGDKMFCGTSYKGVFLSKDIGQSWTSQNDSVPYIGMTGFEIIGNNIFALYIFPKGGAGGGRLIKSSDDGVTWTEILSGTNHNWLNCTVVINDNLYVGTSLGQILFSKDMGTNWEKLITNLPEIQITILESEGNNLLVGTDVGKFSLSTDNGINWENSSEVLPEGMIVAIEKNNENIFVGTKGNGVFYSNNNGNTWKNFNDSLYFTQVQNNCLILKDDYLYCSFAYNNGLYRKNISALSIPNEENTNMNFKIFPNPVMDVLNIEIPKNNCFSENFRLEIYSTLGIKVWQSSQITGQIDISILPSGVYYLKIMNKVYKFEKI